MATDVRWLLSGAQQSIVQGIQSSTLSKMMSSAAETADTFGGQSNTKTQTILQADVGPEQLKKYLLLMEPVYKQRDR